MFRRVLLSVLSGLALFLAVASSAAASDTLLSGGTLTAGQWLASADGHFELTMQPDGNLVLFVVNAGGTPRAVWATGTSGDIGDRAVLQTNGNLVLYDAAGEAIWSSNTIAAGCANLTMQDDGNLVLYTSASAFWSTSTIDYTLRSGEVLMPGQTIFAHGEQYKLAMQTDGNLVLYGPAGALWSSGTSGGPGNYAIMRTNGDLVVVNPAGHDLWISRTYGHSGARLDVLEGGDLVIYSGSTTIWHTGTGSATVPKGPTRFPRPAFTACPPPPPIVTPPPAPPQDPVVLVPVKSKLPRLRVKITMNWTWNRGVTHLHRFTVRRFPRHATIMVRCHGRGCPRHPPKGDWRHLRRVIRSLDGHAYRAGDQLQIAITERRHKAEHVDVRIRWGALPKVRLVG